MKKQKRNLPFVEKYRPRTLDKVVGNTQTIQRLEVISKEGNCPNLILSGPPGTGKTTSIMCLARALLGERVKDCVLELNASDKRGIDVVRNTIKMFSKKKVTLPKGRHKIIILDEADSMTSAAQQALRRIMEIYSSTTRFALACNFSNKIIEPIQSRCAVLKFSRLSNDEMAFRLQQISNYEKITVTEKGYEALLFTADGDMRQAINNLQATFVGFVLVDDKNVLKACDQPHPETLKKMIAFCVRGDVRSALELIVGIYNEGFSSSDIVSALFKVVKASRLEETLLLEFLKIIGLTHMRITTGISSLIQLTGMVAQLCSVKK
ncbi:replication factor c subunit 2 [Anaeramoeba flamelloides]|uniref:Replication factor c subunit 2 n=1 Tax=Anaeramoeba flamelloides TaxID=1746091 RepID=A0ABQ8X889_9EUKA|nr:replication factor c subunit 2 [Anaeramoeba flamelloides]